VAHRANASGHNIALENPAALAQAYLDFFAGSPELRGI
jgi:hypothetical protein